ncbi:MAG: WD40 repeat domain-containing protein [Isosphaeraceae bacterium]
MGRRRWVGLGLGLFVGVLGAGTVRAQDEVRNYRMPVLMVETGGHHARVRSLIWQDDLTLFSGGEDKVVKVWDFREGPRLARSIRPMIWRGPRGIINAMAVSPRPDAQGQSYLAVAGYGMEGRGGDITVFRIPGLVRTPTGEVAARLLPPPDGQPLVIGHTSTVGCLAFDPTGRVLASGGNDGKVILWDVPGFAAPAVLLGHTGGLRAIAFSPDGSRLASGGADGVLLTWDVARRIPIEPRAPIDDPRNAINTLAYSPDGRTIAVGRESPGRIQLYQAGNLAAPPSFLAMQDGQGPVECLAYLNDAQRPRLAVSIKSDATLVPDPLRMSCDVEIREMPGGAVVNRRQVPGLVYALALSPDGRRLAYAGGHDQSIAVLDTTAPDRPPQVLRGSGSTPFDVRFSEDGKVIGFTRVALDPAHPPASYEGFDLDKREPRTTARADLPRGAIAEFQEWTLRRGGSPLVLEAVQANGQTRAFAVDRRQERHAWSWTFIPGTKDHPHLSVAIGTESGVAVFNVDTGARTRVYAGHSSPVVSLAPSPDGRWMASSSLDQTILLYPLAGCDERAPLGAEFRPGPAGAWTVAAVEPRSFAAAMGLLPADVLVQVGIASEATGARYYNNADEIGEFFGTLPARAPMLDSIGFRVRRTVAIPTIGPVTFEALLPTTRRHNPAMALFLGTDREWVLWTPQGYYDTSIEGDARFLGWHVNPPFRTSKPTDFVPIGTFADAMNRRDLLDRLWRDGVLARAANAPAPVAEARPPTRVAFEDQPPRIVFEPIPGVSRLPAPGVVWAVDRPDVRVFLRISAGGKSAIAQRRIILDERPLPREPRIGPTGAFDEQVPLNGLVPNRRIRLAAEATNVAGGRRTETIDLVYLPPPAAPRLPAPPAPRLHVLAIGCDRFADGLPSVEYAGQDAEALAGWLADHLTSADGTRAAPGPPQVLAGAKASTRSIATACDQLHKLVQEKRVREHDIVAIVVASHLLASPEGVVIAAADTAGGVAPRPAFAASDLAEILGQLTDYGCRVVVFLDGVHKLDDRSKSEIKPFVRDLQRRRGAIAFIASKEGPSGVDRTRGHGFFAQGVLQSFTGADLAGARKDRTAPYTLDQFRTALQNEVSNLSSRRQQAACYIPTRVPERTLFARPRD